MLCTRCAGHDVIHGLRSLTAPCEGDKAKKRSASYLTGRSLEMSPNSVYAHDSVNAIDAMLEHANTQKAGGVDTCAIGLSPIIYLDGLTARAVLLHFRKPSAIANRITE